MPVVSNLVGLSAPTPVKIEPNLPSSETNGLTSILSLSEPLILFDGGIFSDDFQGAAASKNDAHSHQSALKCCDRPYANHPWI
jgi:hypothetical protein